MSAAPIPVTVITGLLGSGKTTLINRILAARPAEKIAVIENEYGKAAIDHALLARSRGGRAQRRLHLLQRAGRPHPHPGRFRAAHRGRHAQARPGADRDHGARRPGAGDPDLFRRPDHPRALPAGCPAHRGRCRARHAPADAHAAAREQVAYADLLCLSKRDRTDDAGLSELARRLIRLNPRAPTFTMTPDDLPLHNLLDVGAFNLSSLLELEPGFLDDSHAHHHDDICALVYTSTRPFDETRLEDFMAQLIARHHPNLLRYKGLLHLANEPQMTALQGVHRTVYGDRVCPWPAGATPASTLVFIGRDLPEADIRAQLDACLV